MAEDCRDEGVKCRGPAAVLHKIEDKFISFIN